MARVKNLALADGDRPEPTAREVGEQQVVDAADRLIANTDDEAAQLVTLYDAPSERVRVVAPGVDLERFTPGDQATARRALGLPLDDDVLLFVGRIQPLKAPDLLLRAAARLMVDRPERRRRLTVAIVGAPSGADSTFPDHLRRLAAELDLGDVVRFAPPAPHDLLRTWYRAATAVVVPSYNESFGLVAVEAQACGAPVVAAAVGGLTTAVADGRSGLLVAGHDTVEWAAALDRLLLDDDLRTRLGRGALEHAQRFGWSATAAAVHEVYDEAVRSVRHGEPGADGIARLSAAPA
jgi:D-inositol-3-phosphate glycosyltransferase